MTIPTDALMITSIMVSLSTIITFLLTRRKEAESRGAKQAVLDMQIQAIVTRLDAIDNKMETFNKIARGYELLQREHDLIHNRERGE